MREDSLIQLKSVVLKGFLTVPKKVQALILFAHGSGSSRLSPRNQFVALLTFLKSLAL